MAREKPNLFGYDNYRSYLKDWYDWMKESKPAFSYRAFANWAGFKAPNQLLLVIKNQRNIALSSLGKYFDALKLKDSEKKYFELLVKFNQAKDMVAKSQYFKELSVFWLKKGTLLEGQQFKYLTNWYYPAVREMVNLSDFKETGQWIADKLGGMITPAQARKAVEVLLELGLLKRDANRKLLQASNYVTTGNEVESVTAYLYHQQMIAAALQSLKEIAYLKRNITALTFTIAKDDYDMVVSEINDARKKIISSLQNRKVQNRDTELYQLNFHLFPINKA